MNTEISIHVCFDFAISILNLTQPTCSNNKFWHKWLMYTKKNTGNADFTHMVLKVS